MSSIRKSKIQLGEAIRESAPKRPERVPKVIQFEEIKKMPRLPFGKGCASGVFLSREREGSRFYTQGYCFHDADMDDFVWDETAWDEAFQCLRGQLLFHVVDSDGVEREFTVEQGDHFWAPAGYKYTLKATGVDSIAFWTMAPVQKTGWKYTGDDPSYSDGLVAMRTSSEF